LNTWRGEPVLACERMTERIALGDKTLATERETAECEEPFAALVERQARFVFRVAYAALRNSQDAEDVAQDVFLKLYKTGAWRQMKEERAYLSRAAWRAAMDKRGRQRSEALREDSASVEQTPEQAAVGANWSAVVHRLMDSLPDELRLPLALSAVDEMTSAEIAETLGIPQGTVRTRLMKARAVLKEKLARLLGDQNGR
jgi:RNA polymerase sigma-70 factor (ECF subfamily)